MDTAATIFASVGLASALMTLVLLLREAKRGRLVPRNRIEPENDRRKPADDRPVAVEGHAK